MKAILFLLAIQFYGISKDPGANKKEAVTAFTLLNTIRTNPKQFVVKFSFLKGTKLMPALKWNDTLALVAEERAMDMARRNYFAHTDPDGYAVNYYMNKAGYALNNSWLKEKNANYFESLAFGAASGEAAIEQLILDERTPSLGHRKHLLGMDDWNASLYDAGIAFVSEPDKPNSTYTCVIIAKHNW